MDENRPGFDWHAKKAAANFRKHGVEFEEAAEAFEDDWAIRLDDPHHSDDEERRVLIGLSRRGRLLVVAYTEREEQIRIINARPAMKYERESYEENRRPGSG